MNALSATMEGFDRGYKFSQQRKAQKNHAALQNQLQTLLGGGKTPPPPHGVPQGTVGIVPTGPQSAPIGGQLAQGVQQPDYSAVSRLYAQNGDAQNALAYQQLAANQAKSSAASQKAQGAQAKSEQEVLYRIGQGVINGDYSLDEAKQHLVQGGADPQELAQITDQNLPQYMKMLEATIGGQRQTVKDKEAIFDPLTGEVIFNNRGPQTVSDGSDLVSHDGALLHSNTKDVAPEKATADIQNFQQAQAGGYQGSFLEYQTALKQAGRSTTSVTVDNGKPSAGQEAVDKKYADDYLAWRQGGGSDNAKLTDQLNIALTNLNSGDNITGPVIGSIPDVVQAFVKPEAVDTRDQVAEVVQRNLRLVLGAQFTEKEGKMLMDRAYNPRLDEATNARRVQGLITQIDEAAKAKESAAQYFEEKGTLRGWSGKQPTFSDFEKAIDSAGGASASQGEVDNDPLGIR